MGKRFICNFSFNLFSIINKKFFILDFNKLRNNFLYKIKGKIFTIFFIIYCFGWDPKTVITGDVASFQVIEYPIKFSKFYQIEKKKFTIKNLSGM